MYSHAQTVVPLYPDGIPNAKTAPDQEQTDPKAGHLRILHVSHPTLTIYRPATGKGTGTAIVICPGGGYVALAAAHEGSEVAQRLADSGMVALVLKYRLPDDAIMTDKTIGPLQDAQRAIQYVREHAGELGIDPHKVGIMGFSAGGHLASTAGTHFDHSYIANPGHISLRPDFMVLGYPVISFSDSTGHRGSRDNLLGPNPAADSIRKYSNELQVTRHTPPTFLVHAKDDNVVPVANTVDFAAALQAHHVPVEVYYYDRGGHGFGLHNPTSEVDWLAIALQWLHGRGF
ncbi:acetyl esterase/lipase [Dinghuibacter silviterrae]|uniref:Acetyl esterase/lipase n=2 Tax=Dinghuibacter silviterrae TaxID=1539049 RepID=A0A4R8DGL1_9BACT|nr:acetyl esterase/lipase [Dinghuibacter silviterrae]